MIAHLAELGRPDPYIVGEFSGGDVGYPKSLVFADAYDYFKTNILDFQLSFELNRFIGGSYEVSSELADAADLDTLLHQRTPGVTYDPQYVNSGSDDPWNRRG